MLSAPDWGHIEATVRISTNTRAAAAIGRVLEVPMGCWAQIMMIMHHDDICSSTDISHVMCLFHCSIPRTKSVGNVEGLCTGLLPSPAFRWTCKLQSHLNLLMALQQSKCHVSTPSGHVTAAQQLAWPILQDFIQKVKKITAKTNAIA